ncbi:hypothetical protein [Mesorhizobium sp. M0323]|uniref:hypothetical protein n=1 Tax=Mesorhizobium sp. M0323 TaxID=2956938 RepID=UPI003335DF0B
MDDSAKITRRTALSGLGIGAATFLATDASKSKEQRLSELTFDEERALREAHSEDEVLATPYTMVKKMRHWITPADYGAVGSLATADDEAMLRTINAALRPGWNLPRPIYLEAGDILLTEHNILGQWDSINRAAFKGVFGFTIFGAGPYASRLVMQQDSNVEDKWFYDGQTSAGTASANNGLIYPTFRDFTMTRKGTGTAKVHAFRLFSEANGYPSQKFRFFNTRWRDLGTVFRVRGTANGDSNAFFGTHATQCDTFIDCENPQAVIFNVFGCDFELAYEDIFKFTQGNGLNVVGGSYMMHTFAPAEHFILNLAADPAGITSNFAIQGIRTEMNSIYAKIVNITGHNNAANVSIRDSAFRTLRGGPRNAFVLAPDSRAQLTVERCELLNNYKLEWLAGSPNYEFTEGPFARAVFRDNRGFGRDDIVWGANAVGWTDVSGDQLGATDFSGGGKGKRCGIQSCSGNTDRLKIANGWVRHWPCTDNDASVHDEDNFQVRIPIGSIIRAVRVRKAAGGASATTYQLEVVDADGNVLGQSVRAAQNAEHLVDVQDLWRVVTTANLGTIRVRPVSGAAGSTVSTTMGAGDIFAIEYY